MYIQHFYLSGSVVHNMLNKAQFWVEVTSHFFFLFLMMATGNILISYSSMTTVSDFRKISITMMPASLWFQTLLIFHFKYIKDIEDECFIVTPAYTICNLYKKCCVNHTLHKSSMNHGCLWCVLLVPNSLRYKANDTVKVNIFVQRYFCNCQIAREFNFATLTSIQI